MPVAGAVGGLLVFAHPRCRLELRASLVPVARPARVLDILRGYQGPPLLSEAEQARLVELVVAAQPPGWDPGRGLQRARGGAGATGRSKLEVPAVQVGQPGAQNSLGPEVARTEDG